MVGCTLLVCSLSVLSAPTEQPKEINLTDSLSSQKTLSENAQAVSHVSSSPSTEKREKREGPTSSSTDNKRTPTVAQSDYQENKPPTFVFPVPVDQIIKNSQASPEIHS